MQSLGLAGEYNCPIDDTFKMFVNKMAAVAFCPPQFVRTAWLGVKQEAPQVSRVDELLSYFEQTWMIGQFHPRQWNYFDFEGPRTNNHVEGWHSRLKKVVGKAHPNVYEIIEVFQNEEATVRMKLLNFETGAAQAPRRRKVRDMERRLRVLFARFKDGNVSIDDHLESVKHHTGLV